LQLYAIERQDDQATINFLIALASAGLALISALGITFVAGGVPGWIYALLPIPPIPLFGFAALLIVAGNLRYRYVLELEQRISELLPEVRVGPFRVPMRRIRTGFSGAFVLNASMLAIYLALTIEAARRASAANEEPLALAVATISVVTALLLSGAMFDSARPSGFLLRRALARRTALPPT
jgi:hypothetical protein